MALKKKDDGFEAIKREAEENGINLAKGGDGRFTAHVEGGHTLEDYGDAQVLLDDMLALIEMDERDDLYAYDNGEMGGYKVMLTGSEERYEDATLSGAFAKAKAVLTAREEKPAKAAPKAAQAPETKTGEVLDPVKPNGAEKATMVNETLAQGYLDIASILTTLATALKTGSSPVPFVQSGFEEGEAALPEPAPARTRIAREKRGK